MIKQTKKAGKAANALPAFLYVYFAPCGVFVLSYNLPVKAVKSRLKRFCAATNAVAYILCP